MICFSISNFVASKLDEAIESLKRSVETVQDRRRELISVTLGAIFFGCVSNVFTSALLEYLWSNSKLAKIIMCLSFIVLCGGGIFYFYFKSFRPVYEPFYSCSFYLGDLLRYEDRKIVERLKDKGLKLEEWKELCEFLYDHISKSLSKLSMIVSFKKEEGVPVESYMFRAETLFEPKGEIVVILIPLFVCTIDPFKIERIYNIQIYMEVKLKNPTHKNAPATLLNIQNVLSIIMNYLSAGLLYRLKKEFLHSARH